MTDLREGTMLQLETKGLNYSVDGQAILSDINITIEQGSYNTIVGPSGSGKSTLLRLLADLLTPTSGEILLAGQAISDYKPTQYRKRVSYCFQQPTLFGTTVGDNLVFPFEIRELPVDETLVQTQLARVGLAEMPLTKKITTLSGGEKQRIALIRNLMFKPEILLLDEITTGLDEQTKSLVNGLITHLNQEDGITVLSITHDTQEQQRKGRQLQIVAGRLVHADESSR